MAIVPATDNVYTGNGTTTQFAIGFDYLKSSDVSVTVNVVPTAFTFATPGVVSISPAPAAGAIVRVFRNTDATKVSYIFSEGVPFLTRLADYNWKALLYAFQESWAEFKNNANNFLKTLRADDNLNELPDAATRANGALLFDDQGQPAIRPYSELTGSEVSGPVSSLTDEIALYNGTTGKLLKRGPTLSDFIITLYNLFPRRVNTYADLLNTPTVGAGQVVQTKGHTVAGIGTLSYISKSGSITNNGGTRCNTATPGFYWDAILDGYYTPEMFGAIGDEVNDDSATWKNLIAAAPSGSTINLGKYLISETLVFYKPVKLVGRTRENVGFSLASSGAYLASPFNAAILFIHSSTSVPGYSGDARRSSLKGFYIKPKTTAPTGVRGLMTTCPIYADEIYVTGLSGNPFAIIAGSDTGVNGNANGCELKNCSAVSNTISGFYIFGNDANACKFDGCRTFQNTGWGFYDDSLLGNTYISCEADINSVGGYFGNSSKPQWSAYINCYVEGNQPVLFNVGNRSVIYNSLGGNQVTDAAGTGTTLQATPSNGLYSNRPICFAANTDIANTNGGAGNPGQSARFSKEGFRIRGAASVPEFVSQHSSNGLSLYMGVIESARIIYSDVASTNLKQGSWYLPAGIVLGGSGNGGFASGTAMPTTGSYAAGYTHFIELGATAGSAGSVRRLFGYKRLTTGSNHVLNIDWEPMYYLTGS